MADGSFPNTYGAGILSGVTPRAWTPESSGLNIVMVPRDIQDIGLTALEGSGMGDMPFPRSLTGSYMGNNQEPHPTAFSQEGRVYIRGAGGHVEERAGGTRAWRNNNPGNIEAGAFASAHGAIGSDGRFAIFSNRDAGHGAIVSLLGSPAYQRLTLQQAINRYAPPVENNTAAYSNYVSGAGQLPLDTRLDAMSPRQIDALARAIQVHEGWRPGTSTESIWNIHLGD
jgi:hypothetical protein